MWTDHLRDCKAVKSVFGEHIPRLRGRLSEVVLHQDGPSIRFRLDLDDYPKEPPRKWVEKKFNTAQLILGAGPLSAVSIECWSRENYVEVGIQPAGTEFELTLESPTTRITCTASSIMVLELNGYRNR